jgi:hypothetical protein
MILDVASLKPCAEDIPKSDDQLAGYTLLLLLASPSSLIIAKYARLDDTTGQQDLFDIVLIVHPACSVPNTADVARTPGSSEARSAQKEPTLPKIPPCLATLLVQPRAVTPHRSIPQLQTMTPPTSLPTVITPPTETTPSSMPPPLPRTPQVKPYHLPLSFLPSSVLPRLGHCKRTSSELATHG